MAYKMKLVRDEDCASPKDNSDDHESGRVFLVTTRNRYFQVDHDLIPRDGDSYTIPAQIKQRYHIYSLFAYIHSGVALSLGEFSDPWDSGQIGHVFVTKDASEITYPQKTAESLVEEWNQYLRGDVWGYVITDETGTTVDSCWGFYGTEFAQSEGKLALKAVIETKAVESMKLTQMVCR